MKLELLTLGRVIKEVQHRHHRALDGRLQAIGISLTQWDALRAIEQGPEMSAHALAQATFQTDQAFSTLSARLVQRGWIVRTAGPGRALYHRLTPSGRSILAKGFAPALEVLEKSVGSLSDVDRKRLLQLLNRLLAAELGSGVADSD